jgi:hypothetical protein
LFLYSSIELFAFLIYFWILALIKCMVWEYFLPFH